MGIWSMYMDVFIQVQIFLTFREVPHCCKHREKEVKALHVPPVIEWPLALLNSHIVWRIQRGNAPLFIVTKVIDS